MVSPVNHLCSIKHSFSTLMCIFIFTFFQMYHLSDSTLNNSFGAFIARVGDGIHFTAFYLEISIQDGIQLSMALWNKPNANKYTQQRLYTVLLWKEIHLEILP